MANIRGRIRIVFIVTTFCTGHALGGLARTLLTIRFSINQWHHLTLIAGMIKFICLLLYVSRAIRINLKRKQGMNVVETDLIGAARKGAVVEEDMDFEDERFLFTY